MFADSRPSKPRILSRTRSLLPPLVVGILLIVALGNWFQWHPPFLYPNFNAVFQMERGVWRRLPALPGEPDKLKVSSRGAVWALFWRHGAGSELARLDGASWTTYRGADLGVTGMSACGGFVLDGDEVWAATDHGVAHWDGRGWKLYHEALGKAQPSSIAAANGRVWVIDDDGDLSRFDGKRWEIGKIDLPGANWADADADSPQLASTNDGVFWIVRDKLWRLESSGWVEVKIGQHLRQPTFVGSGREAIWLWDGKDLQSIGPAGLLRRFASADIGLSSRDAVFEVAETDDHIHVATSQGLHDFDGVTWRRLPPPHGVHNLISIQAAAPGQIFAIGDIPNPTALRLRFLLRFVPLALVLGILGVIVWMVRRYKRQVLRDHRHLQQAVAHATGAVPEEFARDERLLSKQSSWWSAMLAVGVMFGAMVGYQVTRFFRPSAPSWVFLAIALALHILVTVSQSLVKRTPKPWDPIKPGGPGFDWGPTRSALPGSVAVFILMNLGSFPKWMGDPILWLLYLALAVMWYRMITKKLVVGAMNRGDYEGALKLVRRSHFYSPQGAKALMERGNVLFHAGRLQEAEEAQRRAVAGLRSRMAQAQALECLGNSLLAQERYDEAARSFEAALSAAPGFRRPYRGMAELALRRGPNRERALEYVENILGPKITALQRWAVNGKVEDDYWALKSWALAEAGRGSEVMSAVAEALRHTSARSRPDLATTWVRLGFAMQAINRPADAEGFWKKAREVDPNGRWSTLRKSPAEVTGRWRS